MQKIIFKNEKFSRAQTLQGWWKRFFPPSISCILFPLPHTLTRIHPIPTTHIQHHAPLQILISSHLHHVVEWKMMALWGGMVLCGCVRDGSAKSCHKSSFLVCACYNLCSAKYDLRKHILWDGTLLKSVCICGTNL